MTFFVDDFHKAKLDETRLFCRNRNVFDVYKIRDDFPILHQKVKNKTLVYFDNAATSHKPQAVIDSLTHYYRDQNSNVHRGVHHLSQVATDAYELAREKVRQFINAASIREVVFVRGTTEGINMVANSFGRLRFKPGDEVVISAMEHHSNIVPWQLIGGQTGVKLRVIPMNDRGELLLDDYRALLNDSTRLVAVVHISNSLGTINPLREIIDAAHERGIPVLVDGAQAIPHIKVDVQALDCDFYAFSGHKMFGPTGIGILYGKEKLLEMMPPVYGGGDMIKSVTFEKTTFNDLPYRFEAGTPNIAGAIGLGVAIDYLNHLGLDKIERYEHELMLYATEAISKIPRLKLIGTAAHKGGVLSFIIDGVHPHDVGTVLDYEGIATRTGHHCTQPVMQRFGIPGTTRASLSIYNTFAEVDFLMEGLQKVLRVFK